jgi:UDP-glucose 4-epimerase
MGKASSDKADIFITGVSGYIGKSILRVIKEEKKKFNIRGVDVVEPPSEFRDSIYFEKLDVRSPDIEKSMRGADIVIHLAFILNPPKDREVARSINLDGTRNVLSAAKKNKVKKVIVLTSATVYGAHPDNPLFMKEDQPIRGDLNYGFWYSEDKAIQDRITQAFAKENPDISVFIVRPVIVFGENVDNYIAQGFFNPPTVSILTKNIPFQFIHELDVARAIVLMVESDLQGPFNLAGDGVVTLKRAAEIMGKPCFKIPGPLQVPMVNLMKRLGILDKNIPIAILDFFRYPWVLDTQRAREELKFSPQISSEEAFRRAWESYRTKKKNNKRKQN